MSDQASDLPRTATSACGLCSLACTLELRCTADGRLECAPSTSHLPHCQRGDVGHTVLHREARLRSPRVVEGGRLRDVGWPVAMATAASHLLRCQHQHGARSVAVLCSNSLTLEAAWLVRQLALEGLNTTQVGSLANAVRCGPRQDLDALLGRTHSTCSREDLDRADLVLLVGADPARANPALASRLERAIAGGAHLAVLHSSYLELVRQAGTWIDARRGTLSLLLTSLLAQVLEIKGPEGSLLPGALAQKVALALEEPQLIEAPAITGTEIEDLRGLAARLARAERVVAIYDLADTTERSDGDIPILAALLASLGKLLTPGSGLLLLRSEANEAGIELAELQDDLSCMLREDDLKGLLVIGEDPMMHPDLAPRLRNLEALVVLDAHDSLTAQLANVVLPTPTLAESEGTLVACDGHVRRIEPVHEITADRSITSILADLAERLGANPQADEPSLLRAALCEELGLAPGFLEQLRADGGRWSPPQVLGDGDPDLTPKVGCWPVLELAESRLAAILKARLQHGGRREAS